MRYIGLDLSTKTGFVALDSSGKVLEAKEIICQSKDAAGISEFTHSVWNEIETNDTIALEGFSYGSKGRGVDFQYGVGWIIRTKLFEWGYRGIEPAPSQVKKFAGAKGNANKNVVMREAYKRWGFEHDSDNVVDAYILAEMCRLYCVDGDMPKFQREILETVRKLGE
ncbi:hypothetical protein ABH14_16910 [Brevibacillus brevis]|uniref:hypothetical protein n=1 Tax=Brevibacillus brevis TaxID=1393 RepID=UPI0018FFC309|nr:hypothetical protein [Brevibacillus brevis]MBH0331456.1 hypothetical protein [Brevibacillus brevis]